MAWASRNCRCNAPVVNNPRAPLAANNSDTASVQRLTEKAPSRRNLVLAAISGMWPRLRVGHRLDAGRAHDQAGGIDLGGSLGDLDLRALQVAELGAIVGRGAMPRDIDIIVETGLRIAERNAGQHIGKQREHRQRIKRIRIDGAAGRRAAGEIAHRKRHRLGDEGVVDFDVVRSRSPQSGRVPGVDDLVVAPCGAERSGTRSRRLRRRTRRRWPAYSIRWNPRRTKTASWPRSTYPPSTFRARPAGKMKEDAISALASLFQTRSWARLSNMPSIQWWLARLAKFQATDASACAERVGAIDQRDIIEFGAADPLRLHDPEQAGVMQIAFGLRRQAPQLLGLGARSRKSRNQRLGTGHHGGIGAAVRSDPDLRLAFDQHLPFRVPRYLAGRRGLEMRPQIAECADRDETCLTGRSYLMIVYRLITNIQGAAGAASQIESTQGANAHGQDRWNRRAWHHGRRDRPQPGRARMARDRLRYRRRAMRRTCAGRCRHRR